MFILLLHLITLASTTQKYNLCSNNWDQYLIQAYIRNQVLDTKQGCVCLKFNLFLAIFQRNRSSKVTLYIMLMYA